MIKTDKSKNKTILYLYGTVGIDFKSIDVIQSLNSIATSILEVRINSPGGDVFDGWGIYTTLKEYNGTVYTYIDGIAASMASIIALAGKKVYMSQNAMYMIHNPTSAKNADAKVSTLLEKIKGVMLEAYNRKTGITTLKLNDLLNNETWYTALEAKKAGFIDEVVPDIFEREFSNKYVATNYLAFDIYNQYKTKINNKLNMELNLLLSALGLESDATEQDILDKIKELKDFFDSSKVDEKEKKEAKKKEIDEIVNSAVLEKQITADMVVDFKALLNSDFKRGKAILDAFQK